MTTWMCRCGASRSSERGGPGGHRGILDIIATLNTEEFLRVKLGIGRPQPGLPTEKYVLSHFPAEDAENVAQLIERAAQAVVTLLAEGLAAAQNRFHGDPELESRAGDRFQNATSQIDRRTQGGIVRIRETEFHGPLVFLRKLKIGLAQEGLSMPPRRDDDERERPSWREIDQRRDGSRHRAKAAAAGAQSPGGVDPQTGPGPGRGPV